MEKKLLAFCGHRIMYENGPKLGFVERKCIKCGMRQINERQSVSTVIKCACQLPCLRLKQSWPSFLKQICLKWIVKITFVIMNHIYFHTKTKQTLPCHLNTATLNVRCVFISATICLSSNFMSFIDSVAGLTALFLEEIRYFVLTNQSSCL